MYFTQQQYDRMLMSQEEAEKIGEKYLSNNMAELNSILNELIKKKRMPRFFNDDLKSLGYLVFTQSIDTYDSHQTASFKTYLWGNIWKKFWTYSRDLTNPMRCAREMQWNEDDKCWEENPVFDVSIFARINKSDQKELWENFSEEVSTEDKVMQDLFSDDYDDCSNEMKTYLDGLSGLQKKILYMLADGFSQTEIEDILHINNAVYNDSIRAIKNNTRTRELRRKYNVK